MDIEEIIEKLSQSMERYETETLRSTPLATLTPTQVHYLDTISHLESPNISELASHLNVSKPTVTFAINNLEKLGYVQKAQSDEDRRFFCIHLTSTGKKMAKLHDDIHKNYAEIIKTVLDKKELATLERLLEKVLNEV